MVRKQWNLSFEYDENMQLVLGFRGLSKCIEMERTCLENKDLSEFIDYDNQDIFMLKLLINIECKIKLVETDQARS